MHFDNELADKLVGKYILIGITYFDSNGEIESIQQLHGIVKNALQEKGILIALKGVHQDEIWNMPPDTSSISVAEPGIYNRRRGSGLVFCVSCV